MGKFYNSEVWIGLDIGSVSVKGAVTDSENKILTHIYRRSYGQPVPTTITVLKEILTAIDGREISGVGVTGSAGELIASLTGGKFTNEIVAQSKAVTTLYPHIRTLVEMGGEDSKMLMFKDENGATSLEDFSMNNLCAAGTGSFLDQQATRIGVDIEKEFGQLALKSKHPPRIAGRCSVFAKSDMIHLQQIGTPVFEIVAGLCYAVARSFKSNVGRGKKFERPVAFFGGVAANQGVVKALADELELGPDELFIPPEHAVMGAVGSALTAREQTAGGFEFKGLGQLEGYSAVREAARSSHAPLTGERNDDMYSVKTRKLNGDRSVACYIGVDIGSLSTNVVAIDENFNVLARRYLRTKSRPIEAVKRGLKEIGDEIGAFVKPLGVGTTGSGRYMIGDFIGADVVRNEITAQATAAIHFAPDVDTIFEIGGQDSKYVSVENGAVVDFEMNKVCAAGTGSFIEEQSEKIDLNIEKDFADTAFSAKTPGKFGDRCTVFIESDLVSNQQKGMSKEDLAAGLSYSIVSNYINRVVGDRKIGKKILFQGGVAWNKAVVAAFEKVTGKEVTVPPHHDVTGAIGAAMIVRKRHEKVGLDTPTNFRGFDLSERKYKVTTFACKACDNVCDVSRVKFEGDSAHYYGARCELFEGKGSKKNQGEETAKKIPDLFAEREKIIFGENFIQKKIERDARPVIGIPRSLVFYEMFPFFKTFLEEVGFQVALSGTTSHIVIRDSIEKVKAETCFPIKIMHGHVMDLLGKGVDYIFMPSVISMTSESGEFRNNHSCPLVQSIPYMIKSAIDMERSRVELLEPSIHFQKGDRHVAKSLDELFTKKFGLGARAVDRAVVKARAAQEKYYKTVRKRGREVIKEVQERKERPVVIISRPYNGCDPGINLGIPRKLKDMGKVAIPIDFLDTGGKDISREYPDMYWRSGQVMMTAASVVKRDPNLDAIFISNFKCGPDSFIEHCLNQIFDGKPCLHLEIDEHSADAGAVTRLEAFFDSLDNIDIVKVTAEKKTQILVKPVNGNGSKRKFLTVGSPDNGNGNGNGNGRGGAKRKLYMPYMCDHAYVVSAALRGVGIDAETLPVSDQESIEIGLRYSSGKECIPFSMTTGDIVKKVKEEDFDPDRSAFFMPTAGGPCRFGLYQRVHRIILDELGFSQVRLLSPDGDVGYSDMPELGPDFQRLTWRGVVTVDILTKLLHETRPYEVNKGETDRVYKKCLDDVVKIVEEEGSRLFDYVWTMRDRFRSIAVDRAERPVIGVVGEIYMRSHAFGNQNIIRRIEQLNGEVWLSPIGEWFLYCTDRYIYNSKADKKYLDLFKGYMQDRAQKKDERRLYEPFKDTLVNCEDTATVEILKKASPYINETFEGEAILSVGKAVEFAERGLAGIVNLMPFTCMPGTIVSALSKKVREDHGAIPWLNLDYDGVEETNSQTRLEAFMYQAEKRRGKVFCL